MTHALTPTDWILRYTATAHCLVVTHDEPMNLIPNSTFALAETDALCLLAIFQRRHQSSDLTILHRPEGAA